jgi:acyl-CoA hydrolase
MSETKATYAPNEAKTVDYSRATMSIMMQPQDANSAGIVHGGIVMKHIDDAAGDHG